MRIVCFHLNQVGDLAFSLPALKCIRDTYSDAFICSVVRPGCAELMQCTGLVDDVLVRRGGANRTKLRLLRDLVERNFDLAVVFSQSAECAVLAYVSGAAERYGFINTSFGFLLTKQVSFSHPPSTENNQRLVEELGCEVRRRDYVGLIKPSQSIIGRANGILFAHGVDHNEPVVVFAPGTSGRRSVKEWTDEGFAAVGEYLLKKGFRVIVLGTEPADNIVQDCPGILDLSCKTNLGDALAILWRSKTMVAVDSGLLHLAAAAGTKVVGLYGPSNHEITGPQGDGHKIVRSCVDCSPCLRTECSFGRNCMTNIHPQQVIEAVEQVIG